MAGEFVGDYSLHKDFIESAVWMDYKKEVTSWLNEVRDRLENEQDADQVRHLQGVAEACRRFTQLPDMIIAILEDEINHGHI